MPRRPDWRRVALERAHARAVAVRERQAYVDMGRIQMTVGPFYLRGLSDAAAARGLTVTAYCRRAIAAFVSADTGIPLADILADAPHPQGPAYGSHDDGEGHGLWTASAFADDMGGIQAS